MHEPEAFPAHNRQHLVLGVGGCLLFLTGSAAFLFGMLGTVRQPWSALGAVLGGVALAVGGAAFATSWLSRRRRVVRVAAGCFGGALAFALAFAVYVNLAGTIDIGRWERNVRAMAAMAEELEGFRERHGVYPRCESVDALLVLLDSELSSMDAWGRRFGVDSEPKGYRIVCYGKDGKPEQPSSAALPVEDVVDLDGDLVLANGRFRLHHAAKRMRGELASRGFVIEGER